MVESMHSSVDTESIGRHQADITVSDLLPFSAPKFVITAEADPARCGAVVARRSTTVVSVMDVVTTVVSIP